MMGGVVALVGLGCVGLGIRSLRKAARLEMSNSSLFAMGQQADPSPYAFRGLGLVVVGAILTFVGVTW